MERLLLIVFLHPCKVVVNVILDEARGLAHYALEINDVLLVPLLSLRALEAKFLLPSDFPGFFGSLSKHLLGFLVFEIRKALQLAQTAVVPLLHRISVRQRADGLMRPAGQTRHQLLHLIQFLQYGYLIVFYGRELCPVTLPLRKELR